MTMNPLEDLSDDDIDALLLHLFNDDLGPDPEKIYKNKALPLEALSHEELLRLRSKNHPDKWPNVNQGAYQAAIEELDRRRRLQKKT